MSKAHRVLPAALAVLTLIAAPACAAQGYYGYSSNRPVEDRAFRSGYSEGRVQGERDARRGRGFSYERHREFRSANDGYRGGYGNRNWYRQEYRRGFAAGYDEGYRRFARSDRDDRGRNYPGYRR